MSPGQQEKHYAPRAAAYRFDSSRRDEIDALAERSRHELIEFIFLSESTSAIAELDEERTVSGGRFWMPGDAVKYARMLYGTLRFCDQRGIQTIYIEMPPDRPEWAAVRDRIRRATRTLSENADRGS
jgi:L-threonylcarbamoyladenylate synthase